jgi:uncharacterized protein (TIGR02118 family)
MSFKLTVMYPNNEDTTFNMDHYLAVHMPLAERIWRPFGLLSWQLIEAAGPEGNNGPFRVFNILTFKNKASYEAASAALASAEIWDDLKKVCNYQPTVILGNLAASG